MWYTAYICDAGIFSHFTVTVLIVNGIFCFNTRRYASLAPSTMYCSPHFKLFICHDSETATQTTQRGWETGINTAAHLQSFCSCYELYMGNLPFKHGHFVWKIFQIKLSFGCIKLNMSTHSTPELSRRHRLLKFSQRVCQNILMKSCPSTVNREIFQVFYFHDCFKSWR
jgi:hypothetical protein